MAGLAGLAAVPGKMRLGARRMSQRVARRGRGRHWIWVATGSRLGRDWDSIGVWLGCDRAGAGHACVTAPVSRSQGRLTFARQYALVRDMRKDRIDLAGAIGLVGISLLLAGNQIIIKQTGTGLSPVFQAGLRSAGAMVLVLGWVLYRGIKLRIGRDHIGPGLLLGLLFSAEFVALFTALDVTSVSRASIIFYTMPMHLSIMAHLWIPGLLMIRRPL